MQKKIIASAMGSVLVLATLGWAAICAPAATAAKPQYGAWGLDTAGMDRAVKPGDDFFQYANGTWLAHTQIPADKPAVTLRLAMSDLT